MRASPEQAFSHDGLMPLLTAAVKEAGGIALDHFRNDPVRWDKAPGQPVTEADVAIDRHLKRRLHGATQARGVGWLSEESEDDPARLAATDLWVVDPIDGTRSFVEGKPEFTISVALVAAGRPVLAALLNPAKDELFLAERGKGATLNGGPLKVGACTTLRTARIAVSAGEDRKRAFKAVFPHSEVVRIGSLAYKMAIVAAGGFDAFFSWRRAHDWDVAAALLILQEAGGSVSDARGRPLRLNRPEPVHQGMIACVPDLREALLTLAADKPQEGRSHAASAGERA